MPKKKDHTEDLPEDPIERCGWMFLSTSWIYGLRGKKDPFVSACGLHDRLYTKPYTQNRLEADREYLYEMLRLVEEGEGSKKQAYAYYYVARATGWLFW